MEAYDENEHCKTVLARAGAALSQAQVLESAVQNLLVISGIVSRDVTSLAAFDQLDEKLRQFTLGRLLREFRKETVLNAEEEKTIDQALDRRNFVAHHFFKERVVEFAGREGRDSMIAELLSYEDLFMEAEAIVSALAHAIATHIGVTEEKVKRHFDRLSKQAR